MNTFSPTVPPYSLAKLFASLFLLSLSLLISTTEANASCNSRGFSSSEQNVLNAYIAYYGRIADPGGMDYWAGRLQDEGGDLGNIIDAFGFSQEFDERFGNLDNEALVNNLFQQLFGRDADSGGLNYYTGELSSGARSLQSISLDILFGAQNEDSEIIAHRREVAEHYITELESRNLTELSIEAESLSAALASVTEDSQSKSEACDDIVTLIVLNFAPDYINSDVIAANLDSIDSQVGGSVSHAGATLTIPAGAMSEDALIGLATVTSAPGELAEDDPALFNQKLLSDQGFLIVSDRELALSSPLTFTLPFDVSALPEGTDSTHIHIATDIGGYLVLQADPDNVDLIAGTATFSLNVDALKLGYSDQIVPLEPKAAGAFFLAGILVAAPFAANPLRVVADDLLSQRSLKKYVGEHFLLYYRSAYVSPDDIVDINNSLNQARALFVDEMGLTLPNSFNWDGKYTLVFDDLKEHVLASGDAPDGFTWAGSSLFEGISYVNATHDLETRLEKMQGTAVHEYFHALQWGAITQSFIPNSLDSGLNKLLEAESGWMIEGSAAALSGRVTVGNNVSPARDPFLFNTLAQQLSLTNPAQTPAADVAQDLFFYMERYFGNVDFYKPMIAEIGIDLSDERERAVRAADIVVQDITGGALDFGQLWSNFIEDWFFDGRDNYSVKPNTQLARLDETTLSYSATFNPVEHLSYLALQISIPPLEKSVTGEIIDDQPVDLEVTLSMSSSKGTDEINVITSDALGGGVAEIRDSWSVVSPSPVSRVYEDYRQEGRRNLYLIISYPNVDASAKASISVEAKLQEETGETFTVVALINSDQVANNSPTEEDIKNADIQISGTASAPTFDWSFDDVVVVLAVDNTVGSTTPFLYGLSGIFVEDVPDTGIGSLVRIQPPLQYGNYTVNNTEHVEPALNPSPALQSGHHYTFQVTKDGGGGAALVFMVN